MPDENATDICFSALRGVGTVCVFPLAARRGILPATMNTRKITTALLVLGLCISVGGCVRPGTVELTDLIRYQEGMIRRSQAEREEKGLSLLRPAPTVDGPQLKVRKDAKTGKQTVELSLQDAVLLALSNNLDIRVAAFDPAITREEIVQAAAVFDYVAFGGLAYGVEDVRQNSIFNKVSNTKTRSVTAGVSKRLTTGAEASVTYGLTRSATSSGVSAGRTTYEPTIALELTQPLLRNAWRDVNLANLRIARINRKVSDAEFRRRVEEIVTNVVTTYWALVQAVQDVEIQTRLLDSTTKTLARIVQRRAIDATKANVTQTESAVAGRRAALIRAKKLVHDATDTLARLLAERRLSLLDRYELAPMTKAAAVAVKISREDQLHTAIRHNPRLIQVRLAVQAAGIALRVAKNGLLPRVDLTLAATNQGLDKDTRPPHDQALDSKYQSYSANVAAEYPLGKRNARASVRRARFEYLKMRKSLESLSLQVGEQVKERIRQIETTYEELQAQIKNVEAARTYLKTLDDIEEIRGVLSPEFLELRLRAQETLAGAERGQLSATINYNVAMITLHQATGTVLEQYGVETIPLDNPGR